MAKTSFKLPYYSPATDKIHNCKKGSREYYHEIGHRLLWHKGIIGPYLNVYADICLVLTIFGLAMSQKFLLIKIIGSVPITFYLFQELFADGYSIHKLIQKMIKNGRHKRHS